MLPNIKETLTQLQVKNKTGFYLGEKIYENGACQILTQGGKSADVLINDEKNGDVEVSLKLSANSINYSIYGKAVKGDEYAIAALLQVEEELQKLNGKPGLEGKAYTREGMMKRVLKERKEKAEKPVIKLNGPIIYMASIYLPTKKVLNIKLLTAILVTKQVTLIILMHVLINWAPLSILCMLLRN
ncbi:MAG: hypothetical protein H0W75_12590 [Chitinophagaceae bacterium]|nr:hypothetical protein [Chitinophagaceae bacterium]